MKRTIAITAVVTFALAVCVVAALAASTSIVLPPGDTIKSNGTAPAYREIGRAIKSAEDDSLSHLASKLP